MGLFSSQIRVPPFQQMMASEENMDREQHSFFTTWVKHWNAGTALPIDGNISYLFCFVYKVLALPPADAVMHLIRLIKAYPGEEKFLAYCKHWLSDCHVLLADYRKALDALPPIPISTRGASCTDSILSLKLLIGDHIVGRDVLTLNGPNVTQWGKQHLNHVAAYLDIIVSAYERNNKVNLLVEWSKTSHQYKYQVFCGTFLNTTASISAFWFSHNEQAMKFIRERTRDAENSVRDEMSIPKVGEGWVSETNLYYDLRRNLGGTEVVFHARPKWLGSQHIDILVPSLSVALEFQGAQHDEPIEYFGGEEAFRNTRRRDAKKKRLCTKNGIRLLEVRPGYDLQSLIAEICGAADETRNDRTSNNYQEGI